MRGTKSKYFQNSIYEAAISSVFLKLLFLQQLNVAFWEFYIHSTYKINRCIWNNFSAFLWKITNDLFKGHIWFAELTFPKLRFCEKLIFCLFFRQRKQFLLHLDYIWWDVDILIFFLVRLFCKIKLFLLLVVVLYTAYRKMLYLGDTSWFFYKLFYSCR